MYLLIDRERMVVTHKHESAPCIGNLMHIELGKKAAVMLEENHIDGFKDFSDYELKMLYTNLCGQVHTGYDLQALAVKVADQCKLLAPSKVNELEVGIQAQRVNGKDQYKYVAGSNTAEEDDDYVPVALVSVPGYVPAPTLNHVNKKRTPPITTQVEGVNAYLPTEGQSATRAPRDPNAVASAPRTAGATKKVWDIADACYAEHPTVDKELRKLVATKCEEQGINSSTMSVQFSKWKSTKI